MNSPKPEGRVDYKEATDVLFERITAADLAEDLGISQNAVARARLDPTTRDYRPPPFGWRAAVARIATARVEKMLNLIRDLDEVREEGI